MSHSDFDPIAVDEIARRVDLSVRQIQRFAREGKVPGVVLKADGYHNAYFLTPELEEWIKTERTRKKGRGETVPEWDRGYDTINPHTNRLISYLKKMKKSGDFEKMDGWELLALLEDMSFIFKTIEEVIQRIKDFENEETIEGMGKVLEWVKPDL